ncbi:OmpA family protein [Prosthecobacter fusiformis]|uniref:OmpA family protein n=1 Tax=Prosthecobacter fusiformis TaxID=48464 RepID=A0A4R7S7G1_9BACT|nr:OmpA family protein [Prosthecobacter fusiformis]TDU73157.1 OmpA family protein [Prosthecobacter fusiformis]
MRSALIYSIAGALTLCSCTTVTSVFQEKEADIVFALGSREGFVSPMTASLKPVCPALEFSGTSYSLHGAHQRTLQGLATAWPESKPRFLIAGYAPHDLPEDYARALSERRAQAVRQVLIEAGVEAANLQTIGFGNDSAPSGPSTGVVVIYKQ